MGGRVKVDVVICFYHAHKLWPYVAWGLAKNQDHIGKIVISADEEWTQPDEEAIKIVAAEEGLHVPIFFVGHPRNGMQQAKCINDGVRVCGAEYILQIDDDIILAPGCVETFLEFAAPGVILTGRAHDVPRGGFSKCALTTSFKDSPIVERLDKRVISSKSPGRLWEHFRDLLLFYRREDYWEVGGHDESYQEGQQDGYGFLDYDFGIKWLMRFGLDSYEMTEAEAFHMGGTTACHKPSPINLAKFQDSLQTYVEWCNAR